MDESRYPIKAHKNIQHKLLSFFFCASGQAVDPALTDACGRLGRPPVLEAMACGCHGVNKEIGALSAARVTRRC